MPFSDFEKDLIAALRMVRRRPAWLGSQSFERLCGFISGFTMARLAPGEEDPPLFKKFSQWQRTHTGIDKEAGWSQFTRFYSVDDRGAYEAFFHDFDLFIEEMEKADAGGGDRDVG